MAQESRPIVRPPAEVLHARELAALEANDSDRRPPGWRLSPRAARSFIIGSDGKELPHEWQGKQTRTSITRKFYGDDPLVERCIITLLGERGLLLVGEPGTAKTMLSELLSAAVSGSSTNTIQGTAGTTEDQIKYSWNYALLLAEGPSTRALVPSPLYRGLAEGSLVRFEEVTRCQPEIQDALVSVLSDKVMLVPELGGDDAVVFAARGFNVLATANLRDRGVNEMSSALKRRFNFETVQPIRDKELELRLVREQTERLLRESEIDARCDDDVMDLLVTTFQDLRNGRTEEGASVDKPTTVMSTAEAVAVGFAASLEAHYFGEGRTEGKHVARQLLGTVFKENPDDIKKLRQYFNVVVKARSRRNAQWKSYYNERKAWAEQVAKAPRPSGEPETVPQALLEGLLGESVSYFPIRHHSPACAWHLERLIRETEPGTILVEGPESFDALLPALVHPDTRPPVAVYTQFVDSRLETVPEPYRAEQKKIGPARYAAYYPFCDYSPELVALRVGSECGASVKFIDLDFDDQVRSEARGQSQTAPRVETLMRERHLQQSAFIRELARRTGCRDPNELWDHLFEANYQSLPTAVFVRRVAAYCTLSRAGVAREELEADGTAAREERMLAKVQEELRKAKRRKDARGLLVVTGGFHSVVLVLARGKASKPRKPKRDAERASEQVVIRYSFDQLDALNGYAAGMPSPSYYQRLWERRDQTGGEARKELAGELIVELGHLTRERRLANALSAADEIAALEQAQRLADFRGHAGPLREDLLDAVRSCCVKGSLDTEGGLLMALAAELMSGRSLGEVAAVAGVPPLVSDLRRRCRELRLEVEDTVPRRTTLDLYRSSSQRKVSRLFHGLDLLGVPFATLEAGPDFVRGTDLDRLQEIWSYAWSPQTESGLVEASLYGSTIEEATLHKLLEAMARLDEQGEGRSAVAAVAMLVAACRMGLQREAHRLVDVIEERIAEEPRFGGAVRAAGQLALLWTAREPLEAHDLPQIPSLLEACYRRACLLAEELVRCPEELQGEILDALTSMRELLAGQDLDASLFWQVMERLDGRPDTEALMAGAVAGLLHVEGRLDEPELARRIEGRLLGSAGGWAQRVAFLKGLLHCCRETSWRNRKLMQAIDAMVRRLDEADFLKALPELRLAFSGHTPRETDRTASLVCELHGVKEMGELMSRDLSEEELAHNLGVAARVSESLERDGLLSLVEPREP